MSSSTAFILAYLFNVQTIAKISVLQLSALRSSLVNMPNATLATYLSFIPIFVFSYLFSHYACHPSDVKHFIKLTSPPLQSLILSPSTSTLTPDSRTVSLSTLSL